MTTVTRWWWIRHAPVIGHGGKIYGQDDHDCDCSDEAIFRRLGQVLPAEAVWVTSNLKRTHRTARSILEHHAAPRAIEPLAEASLAEQHFGQWQGMSNAELEAERDGVWHRFWLAPAVERPPGGESFVDLIARVTPTIDRLSRDHSGRDIVAVTHGGTIRAALVHALGIEPERAFSFTIDNCSLTCIDHIDGAAGSHAPNTHGVWRVRNVNAAPHLI